MTETTIPFLDLKKQYLQIKHALNNGTSARHPAIAALGIGKGDEVIMYAELTDDHVDRVIETINRYIP